MTNTIGGHSARGIAAERTRHGWSQTELAHQLGWAQSKVSALESGKRRITLDHAVALCRALGVPLATLVQGTEPADLEALGLD